MDNKEITTTAARAMTPGYSPTRTNMALIPPIIVPISSRWVRRSTRPWRVTWRKTAFPGPPAKPPSHLFGEYNPQLSELTVHAIEKAINLRFEDRWQSAQEFKDALIEARHALPLDKRSSPRLGHNDPNRTAPDDSPLSLEKTFTPLVHQKPGRSYLARKRSLTPSGPFSDSCCSWSFPCCSTSSSIPRAFRLYSTPPLR